LLIITRHASTGTRIFVILLLILVLGLLGLGLYQDRSELDAVRERGELVVVSRNNPTTWYEGPHGPAGFEYDLAKAFADSLGVRLRMVKAESISDLIGMVENHTVDMAAAGLTVTELRKRILRFGPSYMTVREQVVYRKGTPQPRRIEDLIGGRLEVLDDSSEAERLGELLHKYPGLKFTEVPEVDRQELIERVWKGEIDYTIANSNEIMLARRFMTELRVGFNFSPEKKLAWAFPRLEDDSLYLAARNFLEEARRNGLLQQIRERYYGHARQINYVGTRIFLGHIRKRLPRFRKWFEEAAERHNLDWRLLAAIAYQESQWHPRAVSPTGVKGLMMLTLPTARQMGVKNRLDPQQSIMGGARYFAHLKERVPEEIPEPDRTWMALAAYNIGLGHLMDARDITALQDGNPNRWIDVQKRLPLLMRKKFYRRTRHGYARGTEAVKCVQNIRSYYDILVWFTSQNPHQNAPEEPTFGVLPSKGN